jgi:hypothetical protein
MLDGIADLEWKMVKNFVNYRFYCSPTLCKTRTLLDVPALLDFPPNATHKMCCDMPYLVAIDTIATKLFRGPWDAKGRIALGYCDVVHQEVAKVFLLQHNATLQLGFLPCLFWLQSVLLRCIWGVAKGAIATFLFRCKL